MLSGMGSGQGTSPPIAAAATARSGLLGRLHAAAIAPRAASEEARRRELVLNLFLVGSIALGALVLAAVVVYAASGRLTWLAAARVARVAAWVGICVLLLHWSRSGHLRRASFGLLGLYGAMCLLTAAAWSLLLPATFGVSALLVVLTVVLLDGRAAACACAALIGGLAAIDALQLAGALDVYDEWLADPRTGYDSVIVLAVLTLLAGLALALRRELTTPIGRLVPTTGSDGPRPRQRTLALTVREVEVTQLVAEGLANAEIAERLFISDRTVHAHVTNALKKTSCANRTELGVLAVREGLAPLDPAESLAATGD